MTRERIETPHQLDDGVLDVLSSRGEGDSGSLRSNSDSSERITPDTCAIMREMYDRGQLMRDVAKKFDWASHTQVRHHISGRCSCDSSAHVHYDECMKMRINHRKGAPPKTLAVLNDISPGTVWRHIRGECSHEDGIAPTVADTKPETKQGVGAD